MTLKEFLEKNPAAVEEAANCKSVEEFRKLAEKAGITFDSQEKLKKAFELVKEQQNGVLSDDALDAVSGGAASAHKIKRHEVFKDEYGNSYVKDIGKKV